MTGKNIKFKNNTVNNILTSIASLSTDEEYTDIRFGPHDFPVIEDNELKFAVLPTGTIVYKALPRNSNLVEYFSTKKYPYPSFYTNYETSVEYMKAYFPNGDGAVTKFRTTRPVKIFILNDVKNLVELAKLFAHTAGIRGLLKNSRKEAVRELLMVTGLGTHCLVQEKFRLEVEEELDLEYNDYKLNLEICDYIKDENLKRLSLYSIDLQFSRNLCIALKPFGNDGYIAHNILTAFGETAPIFHEEMMFCFTSDVLEQLEKVADVSVNFTEDAIGY